MTASRRQFPTSPVLVWGDNEFQVNRRARQLYAGWQTDLGGIDHEIIDASVTTGSEALRAVRRLREALDTLPLFGSGKAIWFRDCNFLAEERGISSEAVTEVLAGLARYLQEFPWGPIRLLLTAPAVDRRRLLYRAIEKSGSVEHYPELSAEDRGWIDRASDQVTRQFEELGKSIDPEALSFLIQGVGPNSRLLHNEAEKLALFVGNRPAAGVDDVRAVVTQNRQVRAFALADALGDRDVPRLMRTLDEELSLLAVDRQKSEIGILYGVIAKVRTLLLIQAMTKEGWLKPEPEYNRFKAQLARLPADAFPEDRRFNPLAMHPYLLFRAAEQARRYTEAELIRAMDLLLQCNHRLVSSTLEGAFVLQRTLTEIAERPPANTDPNPQHD